MVARSTPSKTVRPRVLVTGFDAFGTDVVNPSWLAAQALHGRQIAGHRVVAAQLPTVFDRSLQVLKELLKEHRPAVVICLGQAGGRPALSMERVAINVNDARMADNTGAQPIDTPVVPGGPAAYFSGLPIKSMAQAVRDAGVAAEVSQTAGTFVCNHVFYGLMHALASQRSLRHVRGGFVHVPWLPDQGEPSMPLETLVQGLRAALRCAITTPADLALADGALH